MAWNVEMEKAFNPKAVAIVGVSADFKPDQGWTPNGSGFITSFEQLNYRGHIYPVNPRAKEIRGYKTYPSISAIPEPIDLVIMAVPSKLAPEVLEDCIKANAKNIHMYTAGFEETGEPEGIELGIKVREIARRGELRIIGPNCMGLYLPDAGIGTFDNLPKKSGNVTFVSQSGGHLNWYAHYGPNYGIYFSKGISYGNAYVLDCTDFLEYLENDPKTQFICMYLEGIQDGAKLRNQVNRINRKKPVIIWKAGLTATGARAVASHTASLAGQEAVWNGFFKQTGAVQVNTLEEMAEITMTFLCLKPPKGNRVAVISLGGGTGVSAADICSREGLEMPPLSLQTQNELKKFIPLAGMSIRNPLDTGHVFQNIFTLKRELELVAADPAIDMLILMPHLDMARDVVKELVDYLCDFTKNHPSGKPAVIVFNDFDNYRWEVELRAKLKIELPNKGVAVYSSLVAASRALSRFAVYHRIQREIVD
jgi:acyl-CoA synthetase (NDP forming)